MRKVLIIEDNVKISDWLVKYFEKATFLIETAYDGLEGLKKARETDPHIIILDLNLPGMDGMEICRLLRKDSTLPIIMLTARDSYEDRIRGLSTGADDYVIKPFDPKEVCARAEAVLRRVQNEVRQVLTDGRISLYVQEERVDIDKEAIELSHIQFKLLSIFMNHPDQVFSRDQLIEQIYQDEPGIYDRSIDNHILKLRKKLGKFGIRPITTVYGSGYKYTGETGQ